jgi:hypothetical protein
MNKIFIKDFIGIVLFKILLDYTYTSFIVPIFSYMGFGLDFDMIKYFEGWIIYVLLFLLLNRLKKHVLYISLLISFLLVIPPIITLYSFRSESSYDFYTMIIPYAGILLMISTKKMKIKYIRGGDKAAVALALILTSIVFLHYIVTVGLNHINFDLAKVYDLRKEYGLATNSGIFGYINSWTTKVLNIFLISIFFYKRHFLMALIFLMLQILIFGFSGHKEVLFSLMLIVGLYLLSKSKKLSTIIIFSALGTIGTLLIYYFMTNDLMIPSILIRRAFFVPADLDYAYLDYFSSHNFLYWSNSVLKYFLHYPYDVPPVFVIGGYLGHPNMAANTGMFGSGYMHFGIFGIIIYGVIIAFIINIIQQFNKLPIWLVNSIVLMPILTNFVSSDLLTTMLTHGLLVSLLILYLYSSDTRRCINNVYKKQI